MRGYPDKGQLGLIPLSVKEIFDTIQADSTRKYKVSVSYMEVSDFYQKIISQSFLFIDKLTTNFSLSFVQIYNECVNDLITPANKNLDVRESIQGIYINRLTEKEVQDQQEVFKYMIQGDEVRNVAETRLNEASSRSHTVFRIKL